MPKHCSRCNHQLNVDARFCPNCGLVVAHGSGWAPDQPAYLDPAPFTPPSAPSPAGPPAAGPPAAQPPYAAPGNDPAAPGGPQFGPAGTEPGGRGLAKLAGIGLAVVGFGAVGFLALRFVTGGDNLAGGASSPEAVVEDMVAAVNAKDPLALIALMAPDELDGIDEVIDGADRLFGIRSLEDSSDEFTIDIEADRIDVSMEGDNAAIVEVELSGEVELGGSSSGLFTALGLASGSFESSDLADVLPGRGDVVEIIVVKLDGKWFASPMLTGGHYIVENAELPSGEYDLIGEGRDAGAGSPDEAVQALVDVINDPDADDLAAILGGGEGRAALAFRDAIDELFGAIDSSGYEFSLSTQDLGDGRVELLDVEFEFEDEFERSTIEIDEDCVVERLDGQERPIRTCLLEAIGADDADVDTSLWLDTATEDGSRRLRIMPTLIDVLDRFLDVNESRQELLYRLDLQALDEARSVEPGSDIEIDFDGQLYAVNEFAIEAGEFYNVIADGTEAEVWVGYDGSELERWYGGSFEADADGVVRVVTFSEFPSDRCEDGPICLPSGEGEATLRIRRAARQSVEFPAVVSGELGPGDVRRFELDVAQYQTVEINVVGSTVDWDILNSFPDFGTTYFLDPGTYDFIVINTSSTESTSYEIVPTPG